MSSPLFRNQHKLPANVTLEMIVEAVEADDNTGFCISCGAEVFGVEPDARGYKCEQCDEEKVYGAEELLVMFA